MRDASHAASAEATAGPWVLVVLAAKKEVMDPNESRLTSHMEGMWGEQVAEAQIWQDPSIPFHALL